MALCNHKAITELNFSPTKSDTLLQDCFASISGQVTTREVNEDIDLNLKMSMINWFMTNDIPFYDKRHWALIYSLLFEMTLFVKI